MNFLFRTSGQRTHKLGAPAAIVSVDVQDKPTSATNFSVDIQNRPIFINENVLATAENWHDSDKANMEECEYDSRGGYDSNPLNEA